jgi:hypothetical protein
MQGVQRQLAKAFSWLALVWMNEDQVFFRGVKKWLQRRQVYPVARAKTMRKSVRHPNEQFNELPSL